MVTPVMIAIDLVAIVILTFGLYFPRHRRKDLVVAFLTVNVGVLAVSIVLASATVGLGVGLGLFGVLSIIRLRSSEIKQHEIAYYFASLALGLLAGLSTTVDPLIVGLMALLLVVMLVGDHPRLFGTYRLQTMQLDSAYTDEASLIAALTVMLGARVHHVTVRHVDLINDSTLVEVRYQLTPALRTIEAHERVDAR
ncbi:MAG: DUF4956 domain-containing protein [Rhodoglobus sp.]|nr:DUF4956 domain-containing protein [Rhodoglobus sp.]